MYFLVNDNVMITVEFNIQVYAQKCKKVVRKQDLLPVCVRKKTLLLTGYQYYTGQSLIEFHYFLLIHLVAQDLIEKTPVFSEVTSQ